MFKNLVEKKLKRMHLDDRCELATEESWHPDKTKLTTLLGRYHLKNRSYGIPLFAGSEVPPYLLAADEGDWAIGSMGRFGVDKHLVVLQRGVYLVGLKRQDGALLMKPLGAVQVPSVDVKDFPNNEARRLKQKTDQLQYNILRSGVDTLFDYLNTDESFSSASGIHWDLVCDSRRSQQLLTDVLAMKGYEFRNNVR